MNITYCPNCGSEVKEENNQQKCPNCFQPLGSENQIKQRRSNKFYMLPVLIVTAFLIGFFASKAFSNTEKQGAIEMAKIQVANSYRSVLFIDIPDLDLTFSNIKVELIKKESEKAQGTYEITGEVTYDQTKQLFTSTINYYNGMYFIGESISFDE